MTLLHKAQKEEQNKFKEMEEYHQQKLKKYEADKSQKNNRGTR